MERHRTHNSVASARRGGDSGLGHGFNRRRIQQDQIEILPNLDQKPPDLLGQEQPQHVGARGTAGDKFHASQRVALEHLAPFEVASQNFCQAGRRTAVQPMLKGPLTQIALDQQDAFAAELCRATQRQGQQGFAFGRAGGGNGDDLGMVDVQRHAGSKRPDLFAKAVNGRRTT